MSGVLARPEIQPKTPLAKRIREVRRALGDPDRSEFAERLAISANSVSRYERGEQEPSYPVFNAYSSVLGINLHWLLTGNGAMFQGGDIKVADTTLAHVRKVVYNIAYSVAGKDLRRSKPETFAEEFLDLFDYLMTLDERDQQSAEKVVEFGAERLKRASDQGDR
ncbi:helix-turn-helix transcriptional regulator [uncultured Roseibium sp.]|uniref:helix-turn-helix domain-containing protein n=1 Tax=uncultured Roseibium sp. TaxID=1936171 RepID=UPI0026080B6E|nr:helix-turn-helix transcriptional regulator [uncultured Roseibium sp.]